MIIKEKRYFSHIWFVCDGAKDWMASLWRDLENGDGKWHLEYRFRYYVDSKAFGSADRKSWWGGSMPGDMSEEEVTSHVDRIMHVIEAEYGSRGEKLEIKSSDPSSIIALLQATPWMHIKSFPEGEKSNDDGKADC